MAIFIDHITGQWRRIDVIENMTDVYDWLSSTSTISKQLYINGQIYQAYYTQESTTDTAISIRFYNSATGNYYKQFVFSDLVIVLEYNVGVFPMSEGHLKDVETWLIDPRNSIVIN